MKIALLYNQKPEPSASASRYESDEFAEWDAPETIEAVANALRERGEVVKIDCAPANLPRIVSTLLAEKPDICFNIAEGIGAPSREAQIPALLDMMGLRYTASDPATLCLTLDKARTKEVLSYHRIPTPAFSVVESQSDIEAFLNHDPRFPLIVKPLCEGSSKGIFERSVVSSPEELRRQAREAIERYRQPALIERFLSGREFTVALIGNGDGIEALPIIEVCFDHLPKESRKIYSYEAKWLWDDPSNPVEVFKCPAPIPQALADEIATMCKKAHRALRCRDWSRIDVRLDERGKPHILEVNPLPGILPNPDEHSCFPLAARMAGMDFNALINRVLDEALKRYGVAL
ncbi:MAG: ATP-grasp domain-containing protein [Chloroherpetonaceae bacterium]|nr:ATP-grasp domain-containing protein [Chloroherpetonaceae bacterium]